MINYDFTLHCEYNAPLHNHTDFIDNHTQNLVFKISGIDSWKLQLLERVRCYGK